MNGSSSTDGIRWPLRESESILFLRSSRGNISKGHKWHLFVVRMSTPYKSSDILYIVITKAGPHRWLDHEAVGTVYRPRT